MMHISKFFCCLFLVLPLVSFVGGDGGNALAQEKRSFLEKLFGRKKTLHVPAPQIDEKPASSRGRKPQTRRQSQTRRKPPTTSQEVKKPPIEKSAQAKRILVMGDFIAAAMAEGLIQNHRDNPDIVVIKHVEMASGLIRDDYYNWPVKATHIINTEKPDMILIAVGGNDRQAFKTEKGMLAYGEATWLQHYQSRVDSLSEALQKSGIAWAWVGLPPFKKTILNQSATVFNSLYKENATKYKATFIDIWDGFIDEGGNFSFSGYDVNGQTVRLRNNDGINFTTAGYRKLAFYADHVVRTFLQDISTPVTPNLQEDDSTAAPVLSRAIDRIAPTGLWEINKAIPTLAGGERRDVNQEEVRPLSRKSRYQAGRADYFLLTEPH